MRKNENVLGTQWFLHEWPATVIQPRSKYCTIGFGGTITKSTFMTEQLLIQDARRLGLLVQRLNLIYQNRYDQCDREKQNKFATDTDWYKVNHDVFVRLEKNRKRGQLLTIRFNKRIDEKTNTPEIVEYSFQHFQNIGRPFLPMKGIISQMKEFSEQLIVLTDRFIKPCAVGTLVDMVPLTRTTEINKQRVYKIIRTSDEGEMIINIVSGEKVIEQYLQKYAKRIGYQFLIGLAPQIC